MVDLSSFPANLNVAIIGASGGIGHALAQSLENHAQINHLYLFSRKGTDHDPIDIESEDSIRDAAAKIAHPLHLIIVATGFLHDPNTKPEKSFRDLSAKNMHKLLAINAIGPAMAAKYFVPLLSKQERSVFAIISARVGSISDNHLGGWYSYRSSKAALNMIIKNLAIETKRKNALSTIIGLHPGTVDTELSEPFQHNVEPEKLFSPDQSAEYSLRVINNKNEEDTGRIFAWDEKEILP